MPNRSEKLDEFRDEIRSYLIPFKDGVPLSNLGREYFNFMGKNLPFRELGFVNEMQLLEAVTDAVKIVRRGNAMYVLAVCNAETAHLVKMVNRQKSRKTAPSKSNLRHPTDNHKFSTTNRFCQYVPPPRMQHNAAAKRMIHTHLGLPKCVPQKLKTDINNLLLEYSNGLEIEDLNAAFKHKYGINLNHRDFGYSQMTNFVKSLDSENILKLQVTSSCTLVFHPRVLDEQTLRKMRTSPYPEETIHKQSDPKSCSRTTEPKDTFSEQVYNNLKKVIEYYPNGFPLMQLGNLYREINGSSLDYKELGYKNIQGLVRDFEDIFCVRVNKDGVIMLTDADRPQPQEPKKPTGTENGEVEAIPDILQQKIYYLLKHFPKGVLLSEFESVYKVNFGSEIPWKTLHYANLNSMLMALHFQALISFVNCDHNDVRVMLVPGKQVPFYANPSNRKPGLPKDAIVLGENYTPPLIPEEGNYFSVFVSSVDTPGRFWLQPISQEEIRNIKLDSLMDDLEDFYQSSEADRYRIPDEYLKTTLNCAVLYPDDQNWHRGSILSKQGPTTYEVFYYDYGTISMVEKDFLRFLKKSFALLPAQSFSARLTNVDPLEQTYSTEASNRLLNLVCDKPLMALITSNHYMNTSSIILCDTSEDDDDVFLNNLLIDEGLVQFSNNKLQEATNSDIPNDITKNASSQDYQPQLPSKPSPALETNAAPLPGTGYDIISSLGTLPPRESGPPGFSRSAAIDNIQRLFGDYQNMQYSIPSYNEYLHPNLPDSFKNIANFSAIDPEIIKQVGDNILAKKKINLGSNEDPDMSRAAVNSIQLSQIKDSEILIPLTPVNQPLTECRRPENRHPSEIPGQGQRYKSSEAAESVQNDVVKPVSPKVEGSTCTVSDDLTSGQLRFCKRMTFREPSYTAHLINFYGKPCFTSSDVSAFVYDKDIIQRILQIQKFPPCHILVSRERHPAFFEDLEKSGVLEIRTEKVVLYELSNVIKILQFLSHKKETLFQDIQEFQNCFDCKDTYWMTNSNSPDDSDLPDNQEALEAKLEEVKKEKAFLLQTFLEKSSNAKDSEHLVLLDKQISRIMNKLSRLPEEKQTKSAGEQVREFLNQTSSLSDKNVTNTPVTAASVAVLQNPVNVVTSTPITTTAVAMSEKPVTIVTNTQDVGASVSMSQTPVQPVPLAFNQGQFLMHNVSTIPRVIGTALQVPVIHNQPYHPVQQPINYTHFPPNPFMYTNFPQTNLNNYNFRPPNFNHYFKY